MDGPHAFRKRRFSDSHVPPNLRRQAIDILNGIDVCLRSQPALALPALMLIYAGVDGMAYVSLHEAQLDVHAADFKAWAHKYLLPASGLACTADDLYAARCGIVHSHQVDSRLAREGKARHVWYHVGSEGIYLIPFHLKAHVNPIVVPIDQLAAAFQQAVDKFFQDIEKDPPLAKRVWSRAGKYFEEAIAHGEPTTNGSWVETIPPDFGWEEDS